jgi:hypothetical protein
MASTFSNLKFEIIGDGEQSGTWGTTTNTNIGTAIEQAIVGMATLEAADFTANVATLTLANTNAAQDARALCLNIASDAVSAAGTVNVPAIEKPYLIINGSSFTVTVKVSGQTGVAVPAGKRTVVYNNGTDVGSQINWLAALEAATLTTSGDVTLSGGTANGVAFLNGSKVLTTGSALTFDGTNLYMGATIGAKFAVYQSGGANIYGLGVESGALTFLTSNSERMRLTDTGNLGLGVTPSAWNGAYRVIDIGNSFSLIGANGAADLYANAFLNSGGSFIYKTTAAATAYSMASGQHRFYNAPTGTAGNAISFTQAMTLTAAGELLVGKTSPAAFTVQGIELRPDAFYATRENNAAGHFSRRGSNGDVVIFLRDTTTVGSVSVTTTATTYNTSSDYRLKNITGPIANSGAYIDSLNPVEGTWKVDGSTFVGLIAHEVQEASRTTVATGTKDGEQMQGMDYSSAEIIANLIAEVKSLRQRLAAAGI